MRLLIILARAIVSLGIWVLPALVYGLSGQDEEIPANLLLWPVVAAAVPTFILLTVFRKRLCFDKNRLFASFFIIWLGICGSIWLSGLYALWFSPPGAELSFYSDNTASLTLVLMVVAGVTSSCLVVSHHAKRS